MNNITIIGGGTAGWLTALFIQKNYPSSKIKLIESSKIGILGAGEGSTPNLVDFLKELEIDEELFLNEVNGTKKTSIEFFDWSSNKKSFIHGFGADGVEDYNYYAYHFNARLFANFLQKVAISRGVVHIDNEINKIILDDDNISGVELKNGEIINTNFLFDCTGFHRLVADLYHIKWNNYNKDLVVNSAIPFFIHSPNKNIYCRTNAIAMKYGWVWQIPLKDRWGCGYIYNENLISEGDALKEIYNRFGGEISVNKKIKFSAGTYEKTLINNSLLVGLSSGFLEPLEATSIMTIIVQLKRFLKFKHNIITAEQFNNGMNNIQRQNMLLLRSHYNCERCDTEFWKFYKNNSLPEELKNIISGDNSIVLKNDYQLRKALNVPNSVDLQFPLSSYFIINNGNFSKKLRMI